MVKECKIKVAIILATYNGEKYLEQLLNSLLNQSYNNIKIYVCDDCSNDRTFKILKKYKKNNPEIFYIIKNLRNIGFIKNFEKLLKLAKEEIIAFCDQDDIWYSDKLEQQMKLMIKLKYKTIPIMIHHDLQMIDASNNIIYNSFFRFKHYSFREKKQLAQILGPCGVMGNTILLNKQLKKILLPFPEKINFHDYYIAVMCEIYGERLTILDTLIKYRIHSDNTSNNIKRIKMKKNTLPYKDRNIEWLNGLKGISFRDNNLISIYVDYCQNRITFIRFYKMLKNDFFKRSMFYLFKLILRLLLYKLQHFFKKG